MSPRPSPRLQTGGAADGGVIPAPAENTRHERPTSSLVLAPLQGSKADFYLLTGAPANVSRLFGHFVTLGSLQHASSRPRRHARNHQARGARHCTSQVRLHAARGAGLAASHRLQVAICRRQVASLDSPFRDPHHSPESPPHQDKARAALSHHPHRASVFDALDSRPASCPDRPCRDVSRRFDIDTAHCEPTPSPPPLRTTTDRLVHTPSAPSSNPPSSNTA